MPTYLASALRTAKRYADGGADDSEDKSKAWGAPAPPMVSDEDIAKQQINEQTLPPTGSGLIQSAWEGAKSIPALIQGMETPAGREGLWGGVKQEAGNMLGGLESIVTGPGEAMQGKMTPGEEVAWGANTAGALAGSEIPFAGEGNIGIFGGRLSKLADKDAFDKAQWMEANGADRDSIWNQTGWGRDASGEWMYHQPMNEAQLHPNTPQYPLDENQVHIPEGKFASLPELLQDPHLYEAYPFLNDWKVTGMNPFTNGNNLGATFLKQKTIGVAPMEPERMRTTLIHEVNHAIQDYEGMAQGGSWKSFLPDNYERVASQLQKQNDAWNYYFQSNGIPLRPVYSALAKAMRDPGSLTPEELPLVKQVLDSGGYQDALDLIEKTQLQNQLKRTAQDNYWRLAFDIPAPNSEFRSTFTPEESRQITPWASQQMMPVMPMRPGEEILHPAMSRLSYPQESLRPETPKQDNLGFYSKADELAQRGPNSATPEQWASFLKNNGLKDEDAAYTGLKDWLATQRGQISREAIQNYVRNNRIGLRETMAIPPDIGQRLPEEWGGNPLNAWDDQGFFHAPEPPVSPEEWEEVPLDEPWKEALHPDRVLPGGDGYREIKMALRRPVSRYDYYHEHFPHDSNLLTYARVDDRTINGKKTLFTNEIQSDWHQQGQKFGYHDPTAEDPRHGRPEWGMVSGSDVPDAPYKKVWPELMFKRLLRHAAEGNYDQIAWPGSAEAVKAIEGWPEMVEKEGRYYIGNKQRTKDVTPIINRYIKDLPKIAEKLGKQYGASVGTEKAGPYDILTLPITKQFRQRILKQGFSDFKRGGKVRSYTMPLHPGSSRKVISTNIKEFHTGPTYAKTAAKFGKATANKQAIAAALSNARKYGKKKAAGGPNLNFENMMLRGASYGLRHEGMINSSIPGRTDKLPMNVKSGSYVLPADIPSALGQGNSAAGGKILSKMFSSGPYGLPTMHGSGRSGMPHMHMATPKLPKGMFAKGGETDGGGHVPIIAAGGEFIIDPATVRSLGGGDIKKGHKILDKFVLHVRKKHVETLKKLPGPKQ